MKTIWYDHLGSKCAMNHQEQRYLFLTEGKQVPVLYAAKENCCGCTACYAACPMSGKARPAKAKRGEDGSVGSEGSYSVEVEFASGLKNFEHTGAITMLPDSEGYFYPVIDGGICISCHRCEQVCPIRRRVIQIQNDQNRIE